MAEYNRSVIDLLVDLFGNVLVELVPADFPFAEARHVVDYLLDLLLAQTVFQLFRNPLQVFQLQHFALLGVHKCEHGASAGFAEGTTDLLSDQLQEGLEVDPLASQILVDCAEGVEDELELAVEPQRARSVEDIGDIAMPAVVAVEVEHLEEVLAVFA